MDHFMPHMVAKDLGVLSMVCRELKVICDQNEIWKMIYFRTLKGVIPMDTPALHIGDRWSRTIISPSGEILSHPSGWKQSLASPLSMERKMKAVPVESSCGRSELVVPTDPFDCAEFQYDLERGNMQYCRCLYYIEGWGYEDQRHRLLPWMFAPWRHQNGAFEHPRPSQEQKDEFKECIRENWIKYNKEKGFSTVNLCQCPEHYAVQSLNITGLKKNYKSYKRMYLKKNRTVEAKKEKPLIRKVRKCERDVERFRRLWEAAEKRKEEAEYELDSHNVRMINYTQSIEKK